MISQGKFRRTVKWTLMLVNATCLREKHCGTCLACIHESKTKVFSSWHGLSHPSVTETWWHLIVPQGTKQNAYKGGLKLHQVDSVFHQGDNCHPTKVSPHISTICKTQHPSDIQVTKSFGSGKKPDSFSPRLETDSNFFTLTVVFWGNNSNYFERQQRLLLVVSHPSALNITFRKHRLRRLRVYVEFTCSFIYVNYKMKQKEP